ncbi:hypothetical protein MXD62_04870 [Frankia sp. Mgl5]|uniref:hypothetical protein n=1 Tax=Frankia sp. Mgl5 TaxID=2933793 RepID=UPI00200E0CCB|nr:hypothetical protein [Frankia sp. Mgl5]MCK9926505.1 hypothetical protein [Frankia sp. Mgl5]
MTALILAQVAVTPGTLPGSVERAGSLRDGVIVALRAFASAVSTPYAAHLAEAEILRRRDPRQTPGELAHLAAAVILARSASPSP